MSDEKEDRSAKEVQERAGKAQNRALGILTVDASGAAVGRESADVAWKR